MDAGTRIGPYEVVGSLGAGGMGEVYRATDTNLKRQVAIKMLPACGSVRRRAAGAISAGSRGPRGPEPSEHRAIYGFERTNGISALVMELVEGPTLADRIAPGLACPG